LPSSYRAWLCSDWQQGWCTDCATGDGALTTEMKKSKNESMKSKGKILIVDDEPINLEFFDVMLSNLGFKIEKAADGEEALQKVVETDPDLIILDNIMPRLTGWEVTKKLKQEKEFRKYRQTPIIMFSAMDEVKDKIGGLELGVDDYITKPFNFSEVLARIRAVLRNRELAKQVARRERRISLVESLNNSLIFFTQHIRKPISDLIEAAEKLDSSDRSQAGELAALVRREGAEILATLQGLEDEIEELQNKGDKLKKGDLSLEDLEKKLQKHLRTWKTSNLSDEVRP
jgi:DNA-binding response OmpR family regulator